MHEVHRGRRLLPCAQRQHEETSTGVGRQRIKRKLLATGDRVRWRVGVLVGCGRACVSRPGHPVAWRPRAVEQLSRHDEVRSGRRTHATTREDHQSGAGDPAQGDAANVEGAACPAPLQRVVMMVVWPVQEPIVEMVLSLSGARLKMTVLGLPEHHSCGLVNCRTTQGRCTKHRRWSCRVRGRPSLVLRSLVWMPGIHPRLRRAGKGSSTTPPNCRRRCVRGNKWSRSDTGTQLPSQQSNNRLDGLRLPTFSHQGPEPIFS
jgi:hypothetical protein